MTATRRFERAHHREYRLVSDTGELRGVLPDAKL